MNLVTWDWNTKYKNTGDTHDCTKDGHCLHIGTGFALWCCKCEKYIYTVAERVNFYEEEIWNYVSR